MLGRWLPAFNERAEYPPILIAAPSLLLLVMLVFAPTRLSKLALLSLLACTALISPLQYTTGDPAADFGIASTAFQRLLIALDRFVWTADDERESTFVHGSSKARAPAPGLNIRRLVWSIENTLLMRGAGKRWEVKGVPRGGRELGRARFVVTRFMRAVIVYLAMDALSTSMQADDYFRRRISLEKVSFPHRIVILLSAGLAGALALELLYDLICAVSVGVGLWTPDESPDLFGSIRHANSLRGFWGKTWHQCFRRVFVAPSAALVKRLDLDQRSPLAPLINLFVPFALSAAQHAYGIRVMGGPGVGWRTAGFFLVQPFGVLIESVVARKVGNKLGRLGRAMGYVWVLGWMLTFGDWFFDELVQAGMWEVNPAPFSLVKGVTTGDWWTT